MLPDGRRLAIKGSPLALREDHMNRCCPDFDLHLGPDFDRFVDNAKEAARQFGERLREMGDNGPGSFGFDPFFRPEPRQREGSSSRFYAYPQANIYRDAAGALVLEFALAGVDESSVKIGFQGDYLVLSARVPGAAPDEARYERRSYRAHDVERQKYYVSAEDYDQAAAKAVFRAGLLTVTVPAKDIPEADAVRITIVKEGS